MNKLIAVMLASSLLLLAGCSAGGEASSSPQPESASEPVSAAESASEDEASLKKEITALMEKEVGIEDIWSGMGVSVGDASYVADANGQCFVPVTDKTYPDVASLKSATESVFTAEYAQEQFYQYALEGQYIRYKDIDGKLCEDISQGGAVNRDWNTASLVITGSDGNGCTAEMNYINYDSTYTSVLTFAKTADGLRISGMQDKS